LRIENYFERVHQILHACLIIQLRIITCGLFEAYRKCPTKCYRLSKGESGKGNSECGGNEAAWVSGDASPPKKAQSCLRSPQESATDENIFGDVLELVELLRHN
jgi:hypothetical protein